VQNQEWEQNEQALTRVQAKLNRRNELETLIPDEELKLQRMKAMLAKEKRSVLVQEKEELLQNLRETQKSYDDCRTSLAELEGTIRKLQELLEGTEPVDSQAVSLKSQALQQQKAALERRQREIHTRLTTNETARKNIQEKAADLKQLEERWSWVRTLSNTVNGNLPGKEKIALETYIQMTCFDRIIQRANVHFMVMSGGQYELKRRREAENNRSQSGLELDVMDHYNGTQRSVKSLSGGESFKASLSLALGLADEIQSSAGGIRLDTMFVDEGFGSLDEESLSQAIRALSGLTEGRRLVGIISHVSELKEKIDRQIVVTREKSGGSRVEIY
jgi:exonuclease SbcC